MLGAARVVAANVAEIVFYAVIGFHDQADTPIAHAQHAFK
jgi:hypothetical protein